MYYKPKFFPCYIASFPISSGNFDQFTGKNYYLTWDKFGFIVHMVSLPDNIGIFHIFFCQCTTRETVLTPTCMSFYSAAYSIYYASREKRAWTAQICGLDNFLPVVVYYVSPYPGRKDHVRVFEPGAKVVLSGYGEKALQFQ